MKRVIKLYSTREEREREGSREIKEREEEMELEEFRDKIVYIERETYSERERC